MDGHCFLEVRREEGGVPLCPRGQEEGLMMDGNIFLLHSDYS